MALAPHQAVRLARALRDLRTSRWADVELTQAQLATGLSSEENRVAPATLSSWESLNNPKTPTQSRLSDYARFFSTRRSLDPEPPHLIAADQLTPAERDQFHKLEEQLLGLFHVGDHERRRTFTFTEGPVTIICPAAPDDERGPLADEANPNFNRYQQFADLDALMEMWGHVRAENPDLEVRIRLADKIEADDLSAHIIVLGGIGWNSLTRRIQAAISEVPVTQVEDKDVPGGDIFIVEDGAERQLFYPTWEDTGSGRELVEDVALIVRLRNPFQSRRTLTICNGIHSRGVLGAVRCLTDKSVREANERYLQAFPEGYFALLVRVPVVGNESLSPDLQNPDVRLYEWAPKPQARG